MALITRQVDGGQMVEVGPSQGVFSAAARMAGFDVVALEMDDACCRHLREVVGVPAIKTAAPAEVLPELQPSRAVVMWHVIEHLPDPWTTLAAIAANLERGRRLAIATPNPQSIQARAFGARWVHLDAPRHLTLIPLPALSEELSGLGLELVDATTSDPIGCDLNRLGWERSILRPPALRPNPRLAHSAGRILTSAARPWRSAPCVAPPTPRSSAKGRRRQRDERWSVPDGGRPVLRRPPPARGRAAVARRPAFHDFRVVVVDNGSSDGTAAWLAERVAGRRRSWRCRENVGVTAALNVCVRAARGTEFVGAAQQRPRARAGLRWASSSRALRRASRGRLGGREAARLPRPHVLDGAGDVFAWSGDRRRGAGTASATRPATTSPRRSSAPAAARRSTARAALDDVGPLRRGVLRLLRGRRLGAARAARGLELPLRAERGRLPHGQRDAGQGPDATSRAYHLWRNAVWLVAKDYPGGRAGAPRARARAWAGAELAAAWWDGKLGVWRRAMRDALRGAARRAARPACGPARGAACASSSASSSWSAPRQRRASGAADRRVGRGARACAGAGASAPGVSPGRGRAAALGDPARQRRAPRPATRSRRGAPRARPRSGRGRGRAPARAPRRRRRRRPAERVAPSPSRSTRSARSSPLGADDRQAGPEAVEHARAEREAGLEVVAMRRDRAVRVRKPRRPLGVRDPAGVEDHGRPSTPARRPARARSRGRAGGRPAVRRP